MAESRNEPRKQRTAVPVGIVQATIKQLNNDLKKDDAEQDPDKKMNMRHRIATANSIEKLSRLLLVNDRRGRETPKQSKATDWLGS
jgi:hypothetical protein